MPSYIKKLRQTGGTNAPFSTLNQDVMPAPLAFADDQQPSLFQIKSKDEEQINKAFGWTQKTLGKRTTGARGGKSRREMDDFESKVLEKKIREW